MIISEVVSLLHQQLAVQYYHWLSDLKYLQRFLDGAAEEDKLAMNTDIRQESGDARCLDRCI